MGHDTRGGPLIWCIGRKGRKGGREAASLFSMSTFEISPRPSLCSHFRLMKINTPIKLLSQLRSTFSLLIFLWSSIAVSSQVIHSWGDYQACLGQSVSPSTSGRSAVRISNKKARQLFLPFRPPQSSMSVTIFCFGYDRFIMPRVWNK